MPPIPPLGEPETTIEPSPIYRELMDPKTYETPRLHMTSATQVMSPAYRFHPTTCRRASPAAHWKQQMLGDRSLVMRF